MQLILSFFLQSCVYVCLCVPVPNGNGKIWRETGGITTARARAIIDGGDFGVGGGYSVADLTGKCWAGMPEGMPLYVVCCGRALTLIDTLYCL